MEFYSANNSTIPKIRCWQIDSGLTISILAKILRGIMKHGQCFNNALFIRFFPANFAFNPRFANGFSVHIVQFCLLVRIIQLHESNESKCQRNGRCRIKWKSTERDMSFGIHKKKKRTHKKRSWQRGTGKGGNWIPTTTEQDDREEERIGRKRER